jgi:phosphoribosylglycinamide formyltransferase 1
MRDGIAILTSNDIRHRYFVNALCKSFNVTAVGYQDTGYQPADTAKDEIDHETAAILKHHFDERTRQETIFFGHDAEFQASSPTRSVRTLTTDTINTDATADWLYEHDPIAVVVYGTSLIKPPLLDRFQGRLINMHLGLSPYYRGSATNFYPLVNGQPQYVGATIHFIDSGIDTGAIIHHARPEVRIDDQPHTLGCRAILAGIEKMIQTIREFKANTLMSVPQWSVPDAKLYLRKDYHPSQVAKLYELIDEGLFRNHVEQQEDPTTDPHLIP